jgi:hypothetical protein
MQVLEQSPIATCQASHRALTKNGNATKDLEQVLTSHLVRL